jgi:hypothetical protein
VPLTPALFASFLLARLAIGGWMLGFAFLGWALIKTAREAARPDRMGPGLQGSTGSVDLP